MAELTINEYRSRLHILSQKADADGRHKVSEFTLHLLKQENPDLKILEIRKCFSRLREAFLNYKLKFACRDSFLIEYYLEECYMSKKIINVVAAAIEKDGKIFCAQRPEGKSLGGYWEFPGGKLEEGESPEEALIREIHEELNSQIEIISFVNEASYDYDFGTVVMKTFHARLVSGNLDLLEHQDSAWLEPNRLKTLNWAPVDRPAVELLSK